MKHCQKCKHAYCNSPYIQQTFWCPHCGVWMWDASDGYGHAECPCGFQSFDPKTGMMTVVLDGEICKQQVGPPIPQQEMIEYNDESRYVYRWGNNEVRKTLKGRICRIVKHLALNSYIVEFTDNGQREVVSRNALRRVKE